MNTKNSKKIRLYPTGQEKVERTASAVFGGLAGGGCHLTSWEQLSHDRVICTFENPTGSFTVQLHKKDYYFLDE